MNYGDFVDIYNALVDRIKLRACMSGTVRPAGGGRVAADALRSMSATEGGSSASASSSTAAGGSSVSSASSSSAASASVSASGARPRSSTKARRNGSGSAYLVSGAALKGVNGVYTQSGESDGVPKYTYTDAAGTLYSLMRRAVSGSKYWYICEAAGQPGSSAQKCFFCLRSNAGTPPLEVPWERAKDGMLPGPFLTPISLTHAPPTSVLAPTASFEVGDFVRANWAGRGVMYPGEVLAINQEDETLDILYDDGDFESHVPRERVHAVSIELTDAFHAFGAPKRPPPPLTRPAPPSLPLASLRLSVRAPLAQAWAMWSRLTSRATARGTRGV